MTQNDFNTMKERRNDSLLSNVWPEIERRLLSGLTPRTIAAQLQAEGYPRFGSSITPMVIHQVWRLTLGIAPTMNQKKFTALKDRRNRSMLSLMWPEVKRRLAQGLDLQLVASQMAADGYWGFSNSRIGVPDLRFLRQLAAESGDHETDHPVEAGV